MIINKIGALDRGPPMSPCLISSLRCSHVACRIQELPHVVSLIFFLMSLGSMSHVDFKKSHVAVSNLGVEGHKIPPCGEAMN